MDKGKEVAPVSGSKMTRPEMERLEELEDVIRDTQKGFLVALAEAFEELDRLKLYKGRGYSSIEEYLSEVFNISRDWYYKLLRAARVIQNVDHGLQHQGENKTLLLPSNERQARHLSAVPIENQCEVWQLVVDHHKRTGDLITGKLVASIVNKWKKDRIQGTIEATYRVIGEEAQSVNPQADDDPPLAHLYEPPPKKRGPYNAEERNCRESEEFREISFKFFRLVERENSNNFRNVSKEVIVRQLKGILLALEG